MMWAGLAGDDVVLNDVAGVLASWHW